MIFCRGQGMYRPLSRCDAMSKKRAYISYIVSLILFGSNGILADGIPLSSAQIVLWRTLIGSLLLIVLFSAAKQGKTEFRKKVRSTPVKDIIFVVLSGISMGLSWIFLYEAYVLIGVSLSSLAYYTGPVIVMVLSPVLFRERLTAMRIIGFTAVFIGVILANGAVETQVDRNGIYFGLASAVAHALMVIFSKKAKAVQGIENAMIQLICSFLTVLFFVLIRGGISVDISPEGWIKLLILGLLNTGIGCYLYFSSLQFLSVQSVSVLGYLEPLSAVILAVLILGERMTGLQCLGAVLIICGALAGEKRRS